MLQNYKDFLFRRLVSDEKSTKVRFIFLTVILVLILINVLFLNYAYISNSNKQQNFTGEITTSTTVTAIPSETTTMTIVSVQPAITTTTTTSAAISAVRDYFIPLGSGTGQGTEWTDVPGAQATVDFTQYSPIKEIRLEVSVNIPTGNETVFVRLFNVTDKHPVWYSEVTTTNNMNSYLTSSPIIYDFGSKLYQVQIKTQLQYPANITQSRIHVVSK